MSVFYMAVHEPGNSLRSSLAPAGWVFATSAEKMGPTVIAETKAAALIIIISGFQGKRLRHLAIPPILGRPPVHPHSIPVTSGCQISCFNERVHIRADIIDYAAKGQHNSRCPPYICMQNVHACQMTAPCVWCPLFWQDLQLSVSQCFC